MMKYRFFVLILLFCHIVICADMRYELQYRPVKIQNRIKKVHAVLKAKDTKSTWTYNGSQVYDFLGISDEALLDWLISIKRENGDALRILDFGSGAFDWPITVANYLRDKHSDKNIQIEIVGVTGERALTDEQIRTLQNDFADSGIKLTLLQEVEIESIDKILQSGFDLIVSSWTLRHLVDPLGTLEEFITSSPLMGSFSQIQLHFTSKATRNI